MPVVSWFLGSTSWQKQHWTHGVRLALGSRQSRECSSSGFDPSVSFRLDDFQLSVVVAEGGSCLPRTCSTWYHTSLVNGQSASMWSIVSLPWSQRYPCFKAMARSSVSLPVSALERKPQKNLDPQRGPGLPNWCIMKYFYITFPCGRFNTFLYRLFGHTREMLIRWWCSWYNNRAHTTFKSGRPSTSAQRESPLCAFARFLGWTVLCFGECGTNLAHYVQKRNNLAHNSKNFLMQVRWL